MGDIITTLVTSIKDMLVGSVQAFSEGVQALFFVTTEGGTMELSTVGTVLVIFIAIGMAIGLFYLVWNLFKVK